MHDLDRDWPGTGTVSLRLSWDVGAIGVAAGARTNAPAGLRILGLGRRAAPLSGDPRVDGPRCLASSRKTSATIGCFARGCVMRSNFARVLNVYYIMVVSPIRAGRIFGRKWRHRLGAKTDNFFGGLRLLLGAWPIAGAWHHKELHCCLECQATNAPADMACRRFVAEFSS